MNLFSRVLPAMALAASLAPFAASARSDAQPVQDPAHQLALVSEAGVSPAPRPVGRAAAIAAPGTLRVVDETALYAALQSLPVEN